MTTLMRILMTPVQKLIDAFMTVNLMMTTTKLCQLEYLERNAKIIKNSRMLPFPHF